MLTHQACIFVNALKSKFESNLSLLWSVFCLMDDFDLFSAWFKVYGTVQRTLSNFFAFCHSLKRWAGVLHWSFMTKSGMLWQINQPGCDRQQHTLCQNRNSPNSRQWHGWWWRDPGWSPALWQEDWLTKYSTDKIRQARLGVKIKQQRLGGLAGWSEQYNEILSVRIVRSWWMVTSYQYRRSGDISREYYSLPCPPLPCISVTSQIWFHCWRLLAWHHYPL